MNKMDLVKKFQKEQFVFLKNKGYRIFGVKEGYNLNDLNTCKKMETSGYDKCFISRDKKFSNNLDGQIKESVVNNKFCEIKTLDDFENIQNNLMGYREIPALWENEQGLRFGNKDVRDFFIRFYKKSNDAEREYLSKMLSLMLDANNSPFNWMRAWVKDEPILEGQKFIREFKDQLSTNELIKLFEHMNEGFIGKKASSLLNYPAKAIHEILQKEFLPKEIFDFYKKVIAAKETRQVNVDLKVILNNEFTKDQLKDLGKTLLMLDDEMYSSKIKSGFENDSKYFIKAKINLSDIKATYLINGWMQQEYLKFINRMFDKIEIVCNVKEMHVIGEESSKLTYMLFHNEKNLTNNVCFEILNESLKLVSNMAGVPDFKEAVDQVDKVISYKLLKTEIKEGKENNKIKNKI